MWSLSGFFPFSMVRGPMAFQGSIDPWASTLALASWSGGQYRFSLSLISFFWYWWTHWLRGGWGRLFLTKMKMTGSNVYRQAHITLNLEHCNSRWVISECRFVWCWEAGNCDGIRTNNTLGGPNTLTDRTLGGCRGWSCTAFGSVEQNVWVWP